MKKKYSELISKTIAGLDLTDHEKDMLESWINENDNNKSDYENLTNIEYKIKVNDLSNNKIEIFDKINKRIYSGKRLIRNLWIASASVAAIFLTFFIGRFSINNTYFKAENKVVVYNEINVPKGAKSQITLGDGTKIWINGGSKLRYPSDFASKSRDVELDGEAFFDVAHDKSRPFFVNTGSVQIKVLGTAFNVKSYSVDKTVETTLVRGSVEIREIKGRTLTAPLLMKPNEKAVLIKGEGSLTINHSIQGEELKELPDKLPVISIDKVNIAPAISWKEQSLVFDNITFEQVATTLERWYGVKVNIESETLRGYKYKGRFSHNETIYEVLEVIKVTTPIKYEVKNYEINIGLK